MYFSHRIIIFLFFCRCWRLLSWLKSLPWSIHGTWMWFWTSFPRLEILFPMMCIIVSSKLWPSRISLLEWAIFFVFPSLFLCSFEVTLHSDSGIVIQNAIQEFFWEAYLAKDTESERGVFLISVMHTIFLNHSVNIWPGFQVSNSEVQNLATGVSEMCLKCV